MGEATAVDPRRREGCALLVYNDVNALKTLSKRFRQLKSREMTRKDRSDLYADMLDLFTQLYNVVQDPDAPEYARWSVLVRLIPKRGLNDSGGNDLLLRQCGRVVSYLYCILYLVSYLVLHTGQASSFGGCMAQASYFDTARRLASFLAGKARFVTTSKVRSCHKAAAGRPPPTQAS